MRASIAADQRVYERTLLVHCHDYCQLVFPERGRLDITVGVEKGAVTGSRLAVILPGSEHVSWTDSHATCLVVDLSGDVQEIVPDGKAVPAFRPLDERLHALKNAVATELRLGGLSEPLIADGLTRYAIAALLQDPVSRPPTSTGGRRIALLAREAIDASFCSEITIPALALEVGASVSHLQRSFKAEHGVGIVRYVLERRLSFASRLLFETDHPVTTIAFESGFDSASYFSRRFTERFGLSPLAYRTSVRAGSDKISPQS